MAKLSRPIKQRAGELRRLRLRLQQLALVVEEHEETGALPDATVVELVNLVRTVQIFHRPDRLPT